MKATKREHRIGPGWWALGLVAAVTAFTVVCSGFYVGAFRSYDIVTLTSDRAGLVLESGSRVKMRGVEVGKVGAVNGGHGPVSLQLELVPDQMKYIPANVEAEIRATTAFGA